MVWFGWGGSDNFLNQFKERFLDRVHNLPFFYDYKIDEIREEVPSILDPVKHTQGLLSEPIENHLIKVLGINQLT